MFRGGSGLSAKTKKRKKAVKVSVPYAPTRKGKEAEERDRGKVTVPHAPTPTGKAAEKKAKRARKIRRSDPFTPSGLTEESLTRASKRQRREARKLKKALKLLRPPAAETKRRSSSQPVLDRLERERDTSDYDPIAAAVDLQVVEPAKRAKVLPKDKTTGQKIYGTVAEVGATALPFAPELAAGAKALNLALRGASAGGTKVGGTKALSRVLKPQAVTSPKARAEVALRADEKAARKIARKKGYGASKPKRVAKRVGDRVVRAEKRTDRAAARRATGTATARETFASATLPAKAAKVGALQTPPVVRGHEQALVENPRKTLKTTARTLPGLVTAPVGLVAQAGVSAGRAGSEALHEAGVPGFKGYSSKEITGPLSEELAAQLEFAKTVARTVTADDPDDVQREVEDNLGLLLPAMAAIGGGAVAKGVSRGKITESVRGLAESARRKRGAEHGSHRGTPRVFEKRGQRKDESVRAANSKLRIRREVADRVGDVRLHASKAKGSEVLRKVPGKRKRLKVHTGDAVGFIVRHDLPIDNPEAALAEVQRIGRGLKALPEGVKLPAEQITTRDVIAYLERNPKVFGDPDLRKAVAAYKDQARYAREHPELSPEHSERARNLSVASTHDIRFPEERFPKDVRELVRSSPRRGKAAKDVLRAEAKRDRRRAKAMQRKAATREGRARSIRRELAVRERVEPGRKVNQRVAAKAERFDAQARTYRQGAKRAEEMAKAKQTASRVNDPALLDEFLREVEATGRDPEYVYTGRAKELPVVGSTGAKLTQFPGRSKFRKGTAEEFGMVQEGLEPLLRESIARPISRRESYKAMRGFVGDNEVYAGGKSEFTAAEARALFDEGTVNRQTHALIPRQLYKRAYDEMRGVADKLPDAEWVAQLRATLDADAQGAMLKGKSNRRYKVVPKEAATEFFAQMTSERVIPTVAKVNRATSYLILATSPAWAAMQILAEYSQAAVAQPKLLNPAYVGKLTRAYREMEPHKRQDFESWVGVTQRTIDSSKEIKLGLESGDIEAAGNAYGVMNRSQVGRMIRSIPHSIEQVDRWKGGRLRVLEAAAKIDKDLNGRVNQFLRGIGGLYREGERVSKELTGKPLKEQLEHWADHPKAAKRYQSYLDDVMGNWSALTRHERVASQIAIFYPFLRMSLRWTFYSFPKRHPVKAMLGLWLGQQNANELKKLIDNDPSFFSKWGQVPLHLGDGETKIVDLSRIAPGSNAIVEAVGGGGVSPGTAALRVSQPALTAVITAATGVVPLSGEQEPNAGWNALSQLLSLSPLSREADRRLVPAGEKRAKGSPALFGATERQDSLDKLFAKLRGSEIEESIRRLSFPPLPKETKHERDVARLSGILDAISANSTERRKDREIQLYNEGVPKAKKDREVGRMKTAYDQAQGRLDKLFEKYGVPYKAEEERFFEYYEGGYGDQSSSSSGSPGAAFNDVFGTGGGSSGGGKKSPYEAVFGP